MQNIKEIFKLGDVVEIGDSERGYVHRIEFFTNTKGERDIRAQFHVYNKRSGRWTTRDITGSISEVDLAEIKIIDSPLTLYKNNDGLGGRQMIKGKTAPDLGDIWLCPDRVGPFLVKCQSFVLMKEGQNSSYIWKDKILPSPSKERLEFIYENTEIEVEVPPQGEIDCRERLPYEEIWPFIRREKDGK